MTLDKKTLIQRILDSPFFEEEDWRLIDRISKKHLKSSREDYLENRLNILFDPSGKEIVDLVGELKADNVLSIKEDMRRKVLSRATGITNSDQIFGRAWNKLPDQDRDKLFELDKRILKQIISDILNGIDDAQKRKFVADSIIQEFRLAGHRYPRRYLYEDMADFIDTLINDKTESLLIDSEKRFFYFGHLKFRLEKIHDQLLTAKLIESNPRFIQNFENQTPENSFRTKWIGTQPQVLHFLFLCNNRNRYIDGESLHLIAWRLFRYNSKVSQDSLRAAHYKWLELCKNPEYLNGRMAIIEGLFS